MRTPRSIIRSIRYRAGQAWTRWRDTSTLRLDRLAPQLRHQDLFPSIDEELGPFRQLFKGNILNAGAGGRDIRHLVDGRVFNQDLPDGLHSANIDIFSPLHRIPKEDGFFDAVICNAVLEHVENPDEAMEEFRRVCKPDGILYLVVPFMQPEHLDPTDYQRYTIDGLQHLVTKHGFDVLHADGLHSVYVTLGWVIADWLGAANTVEHFLLKCLLFPYIRRKCRTSRLHVHSLASAYRVVARRRLE